MRDYGLSAAQQDEVWRRWRAGESLRGVARAEGVPVQHVRRFFAQTGGVQQHPSVRARRHLSVMEREEISRGLCAGLSLRRIAVSIGRPHCTVVREVSRNGGRADYRAGNADVAATARARRPKKSKLQAHPRLRQVVEDGLGLEWSPEQISARLRLEHPDDAVMRISHETIYLSLFVPARAGLRRELTRRLRTGRAMRSPKVAAQSSGRGRLRNMTSIHDRPAEVVDRLVPGHWEGDLVMGRRPSAVATLVERASRYLRLVALPSGIKAGPVGTALTKDLAAVPQPLRRSLTWDRGREMAEHAVFSEQTGCRVYFCDPRSPWQRGTNENTNRLLRQYLSKSSDLAAYDQTALDVIAARLNNRPRRTLGWRTPAEAFTEAVQPNADLAAKANLDATITTPDALTG